VPEEVWRLFEPILPPVVWCGNRCPPYDNRQCLHALLSVLVTGMGWRMLPTGFPSYTTVQRRLRSWLELEALRTAGRQLAHRYEALQGIKWMRGCSTGPRPVDRGKGGTALPVAWDARAMPLGGVATGANMNEGWQTEDVLQALVVYPPAAESCAHGADLRSFPRVQADGAYGNGPSRERARHAGFRLHAPTRGNAQPGVGKMRTAVERCHNFFAQFGRVVRRFARSARHYLGWLELAARILLLRSGFVS
jgi:transposase